MLILFNLLAFLIPTQLALHLNELSSTVYGFRIDYLIPAIYLTDLVALAIIFFSFKKLKLKFWWICLFLIFAVSNILVSGRLIPSVYKWIKVTEMLLLGIAIIKTKSFKVFDNFVKPLSCSVFIVCILGIWQFFIKGSVGGIFYWLGERNFMFSDPNIAPFPYSTFSHPNSFAGFLLVFGIFILQYKNQFNQKHFWCLLSLVAVNLFLTNSLNVYIAIIFLIILKFRSNLSYLFFAFDFSERYIAHRIELIKASFQMISNHFWFGVGLNNFIPNLVKISNTFLNSWELQPVHNIFLLIFSETGVIGLVVFCFLVFSSLTPGSYSLIAVLITGLSDHYWITLQQNILLFTFVLALSLRVKKK